MNIHDRIQAAIRRYMGRTSGRYPSAIAVASPLLQQLLACPFAVSKMRAAYVTDDSTRCAFVLYAGMWLLVSSGKLEFVLLDELLSGIDDAYLIPISPRFAAG